MIFIIIDTILSAIETPLKTYNTTLIACGKLEYMPISISAIEVSIVIFSPPYSRSCCKYATCNLSLRFDACYTFLIACTPCTHGCFLPILHTLSKARLCTDYTFFVLFSLFHLQIIRFISTIFACFNLVSVFVGVAR